LTRIQPSLYRFAMKRLLPLIACLGLLSACSGSQTEVYDRNGLLKGHVTVNSQDSATIVNKAGSIVGEVKGSDIYSRTGVKAGSVQDDGDIMDRSGNPVGSIHGAKCVDDGNIEAGHLTSDIDDQAAAGACLLLLLQ
jgi:hypothetical protein